MLLIIKRVKQVGKTTLVMMNMRARGALISQNQLELSCEFFRQREALHDAIDALPDLKSKKAYAAKNSIYRTEIRDAYTISYVGRMDWGGLAEHIRGVYTITDGDLIRQLRKVGCLLPEISRTQSAADIRASFAGVDSRILLRNGGPQANSL